MANYKVTYEIEVEAKSHIDAAKQVEQYMKNGFYRPFLVVKNTDTGTIKEIDLDEIGVRNGKEKDR